MDSGIPRWFLQSLAGLLGAYFIWTAGNWIGNVNAEILFLKRGLIDSREEQMLNFIWLADQLEDPVKGKELRNKLYDLRINRK